MLITFGVLLLLLWLIGLLSGLALGAWIHALLVLAVATIALGVARRVGRRRAAV